MDDNLLLQQPKQKMAVYLKDTYGLINNRLIDDDIGEANVSLISEKKANNLILMEFTASKLFLAGHNIFNYLYHTSFETSDDVSNDICQQIITLVVPGLRNVYYDNRKLFGNEINKIEMALNSPLPTFYNIFDYKSLENNDYDFPQFQLIGTITQYDVVYLSVYDYVNLINNQKNIVIQLFPTNIFISLNHNPVDFYDSNQGVILPQIDINKLCV